MLRTYSDRPSACKVLPLTREWIEMAFLSSEIRYPDVLPLTREWIEILEERQIFGNCLFSLLRGSGLKFDRNVEDFAKYRSPSYEGVD